MSDLPPFPVKHVPRPLMEALRPLGEQLEHSYPDIGFYLTAAYMDVEPEEYLVLGIVNALVIGGLTGGILLGLGAGTGKLASFGPIAVGSGFGLLLLTALYWVFYPKVRAGTRADEIEQQLLFALRDLSVDLSAGTSLTEALGTLTEGYGTLSEEMERTVSEIRTGKSLDRALRDSIDRTTSDLYRSAVMRIVTGMHAGTSIPHLLDTTITNLAAKQQNEITEYGEHINTWSTIYLVVGIVLPSMGLTVLILLSAFTGTQIGRNMVIVVLLVMVLFHVSALNLLRSRRPAIEV